jgi:hypothetical protein
VRFIAASNPGGIGHQWVKQYWIDRQFPVEMQREAHEFCFIPALPDDNPHLPPSYWQMLETLPEPLRLAWRYGRWDVFSGQAFPFGPQHVVDDDTPIPAERRLYMTFDWGFGKPYSVGWWYEDEDGRLMRFDEIYGCRPGEMDVGLRQTDDQIATEILAREETLGIGGREIVRLCDPTCFNRKPDYISGGQSASTAETFARHGLHLTPGDPSRHMKIRQFQARLRATGAGGRPMMQVYRRCTAFTMTIPLLQVDERNVEDIDTRGPDHGYDDACLICQAMPLRVMQSVVDNLSSVEVKPHTNQWRAARRKTGG